MRLEIQKIGKNKEIIKINKWKDWMIFPAVTAVFTWEMKYTSEDSGGNLHFISIATDLYYLTGREYSSVSFTYTLVKKHVLTVKPKPVAIIVMRNGTCYTVKYLFPLEDEIKIKLRCYKKFYDSDIMEEPITKEYEEKLIVYPQCKYAIGEGDFIVSKIKISKKLIVDILKNPTEELYNKIISAMYNNFEEIPVVSIENCKKALKKLQLI